MNHVKLFLCGSLWQNLGDSEAGLELVRCLRSADPEERTTVEDYLVEAGPRSIKLVQTAVASRTLDAALAADCLTNLIERMACDADADESTLPGFTYDS